MRTQDRKNHIKKLNTLTESRYLKILSEGYDYPGEEVAYHDKATYEDSLTQGVSPMDLQIGKQYLYKGENSRTQEPITGNFVYNGNPEPHSHLYSFKVLNISTGEYKTSFTTSAEGVKKHIFNVE